MLHIPHDTIFVMGLFGYDFRYLFVCWICVLMAGSRYFFVFFLSRYPFLISRHFSRDVDAPYHRVDESFGASHLLAP